MISLYIIFTEETFINHVINKILDILFTFSVFGWMGWSSFSIYKNLKIINIQPWILTRYKLLAYCSFIMSMQAIPELIAPHDLKYSDPVYLLHFVFLGIMLGFALTFSLGTMLAWVMPKSLKEYLNRNYIIPKDECIEETELLAKIKDELDNNT